MKTDILIAGCGCSGLYAALKLPRDKQILILSKSNLEKNDSFLAQGGMCVLKDESDFDSYFEDTMKAGHYENDPKTVEIMIRSSRALLEDLMGYGAEFARNEDGTLDYTREGGHSDHRIVYHKDVTGKEITSHLLEAVKKLPNVKLVQYATLVDIISDDNTCYGGIVRKSQRTVISSQNVEISPADAGFNEEELEVIEADFTILATGGIGGLYRHSTNYRHLTGDGLAMAIRHGVALRDINYVQVHPTTFYSEVPEHRSFLISESVRGEGALLYDKNMQRFTNELLPRDLLTAEVRKQMAKDGTEHVWEDMRPLGEKELKEHFPNIVAHCAEMGYDAGKECIPVVPAQHYFMGGIRVGYQSETSMKQLYAVGETACNGVHGRNRLASNSLLESMVFAGRAAEDIAACPEEEIQRAPELVQHFDTEPYRDAEALEALYRQLVLDEIKKADMQEEKANV